MPMLSGNYVTSERLEPLSSRPKLGLTFVAYERIVVSLRWAGVAQG
jgi:hypothetical protein